MTDEPEWDDRYDPESDIQTNPTQAVVTGTGWTVETVLSQLRRGNIELSPRFQRRDAWTPARKSKFIESLILQLPIPQLVLAESKAERGRFIVLDGKQRLLSLLQFAAGSQLEWADGGFNPLPLQDLDIRPDLEGYTLELLERSPDHVSDLNALMNQTIRTTVVRSWPDTGFLNLVFLRLNTGSLGLSPQELRQALVPGPFTDFLDDFASDSPSIRAALRLRAPDFRMRDIEVALRFFAFTFFLDDYRGNLRAFLDLTSERLNARWDADEALIRATAMDLEDAINCVLEIWDRDSFRRWDDGRFQRTFNRAIFDVLTYYFKVPELRMAALANPDGVRRAFELVSEQEPGFVQAVQSTTKSTNATLTRLNLWGRYLYEALQVPMTVPAIADDPGLLEVLG